MSEAKCGNCDDSGCYACWQEKAKALRIELAQATERERYLRNQADEKGARLARYTAALRAIVDTDTHGKNVHDEHGSLRPSGMDFCGRCNRNGFHPHADDCPIAMAIKLIG